jgi:hypothetical protein
MKWYRSFFPFWFRSKTEKLKWITGEATPYYIFHPLACERVRLELPSVKLIILIRNPIDRALSHYHHEVKSGFESLSFRQAVLEEENRISGERERIVNDQPYRSFAYQHFTYIKRGLYLEQISKWEDHFSQDQILILVSEEFFSNPASTLDLVCNFLEIKNYKPSSLGRYNDGQYPPMDTGTRQMLRDYYKPHNQRLEDHLKVNLDWDD